MLVLQAPSVKRIEPKRQERELDPRPLPQIDRGRQVPLKTALSRFELLELDCSFMPSSHLATRMFVAIEQITSKQTTGCVVLIDNINEADAEWRALLDQYADHHFDALVNTADAAAPDGIRKERQKIDHLPENLFVIGEQRSD